MLDIYVVKSGDTVWRISQRYGVNLNQIIEANQITNSNQLVIGQALVIPEAVRYHLIQQGETLWNIAQRYGVTIESIIYENEITDPALIYAGQRLKIPTDFHIVKAGETLWAISIKYGVPVQDIVRVNRIANPAQILIGQRLIIPRKAKPLKEVNAYITRFDQSGQQIVREIGEFLTYLSPFSYQVRVDGTVQDIFDTELLNVAKTERVAPLMIITNFKDGKFNSDLANTIFTDGAVQDKLFDNLIQIINQKGYVGVNVDFEYIYPEDREKYNTFLRRMVARLRPLGYSVSTALAPKYSSDQKGVLYEAHDYAAHGEIVDFVIIMTYEWGWSGGPPMAVAPLNEVRKVIQYALSEIPSNKIMMGVPLYGYDWTLPYVQGGPWAAMLSPQGAVERAAQYGAAIKFDERTQSPFYNYYDNQGKEHVVWFEDARSVEAKYELVIELNLRGVSYWVLGNPFPQNWFVLADNFRIQKF